MGLFLAMSGLGNGLAAALAAIVKRATDDTYGKWFPDNLNNGSLECYLFLLAGLMLVNTAVFLWLAVKYRSVDRNHDTPESNANDFTVTRAERVFLCVSNSSAVR